MTDSRIVLPLDAPSLDRARESSALLRDSVGTREVDRVLAARGAG